MSAGNAFGVGDPPDRRLPEREHLPVLQESKHHFSVVAERPLVRRLRRGFRGERRQSLSPGQSGEFGLKRITDRSQLAIGGGPADSKTIVNSK